MDFCFWHPVEQVVRESGLYTNKNVTLCIQYGLPPELRSWGYCETPLQPCGLAFLISLAEGWSCLTGHLIVAFICFSHYALYDVIIVGMLLHV